RRNLPAICECADASDSDYPDGMIANRAIEILEDLSSAPEPFFLATGFYRPHLPWAVPQKYWDLYSRNDVDLADNPFLPEDGIQNSNLSDFLHYGDAEINSTYSDIGHYEGDGFPVLSEQKQRECVHAYWASVSFVDAQIGKVLDELERLNLLDDTVIVLWGDNGWHLGEHGLWSKVTSFEEATRVPLIVSAPGFTSDVQSDAMVELVDIYPTLCSLLGLQCPDHLEGLSFEPILEEPAKPWKKAVFSRIFDAETLRTGRYRFTRYAEATPEGDQRHRPNAGVCELFDHLTDPRENVNVARRPERRELVKKLDDQLSAGWRAVLPDICLGL
ncbi:MAG: sulfatase-like hydrolase/transferase, partial [Candidatus Latescibacteria bacterium]|nr:sulfatase-like hydrolase/transferase [Candidatus Latescibacterota bacterium]